MSAPSDAWPAGIRALFDALRHGHAESSLDTDELGALLALPLEDLNQLGAALADFRIGDEFQLLRDVLDYARSLRDPMHRQHAAWQAGKRVPADLVQAYEATRFVVFDGDTEIVLRIGERSDAIAALHRRCGVATSSIITAWNPRSRQLPADENAARQRRLAGRIAWLDLPSLRAEGRDPADAWTPEQSLWIAGAGLNEDLYLGRMLDQNAIVSIGPDAVPRLAWPGNARALMGSERLWWRAR
jgi:hypothetical protein